MRLLNYKDNHNDHSIYTSTPIYAFNNRLLTPVRVSNVDPIVNFLEIFLSNESFIE